MNVAGSSPVRGVLVVLGAVLLVSALRTWRRRRAREDAPPERRHGALLGRVVLAAAEVGARLPGMRRESDDAVLPTRLAVAPETWPAVWMSAALAAWQERTASTSADPARPPDLGRLAAGIRLLSTLVGGCLAAGPGMLLGGPTEAAVLGGLGAAAGARMPDLTLGAAARTASRAAALDTAATVDMLAATASAGLSLPEALVLTAGHAPPALSAVLRAVAIRGALGDEPQASWAAEAHRYRVPVLGDVAEALDRQRRLGVPLGPELARIAGRLRAEERARTLRRAARRGPLGTLVVALVIAPLCLAAVIACLVGGLLRGGGLGLH